MKINCTIYKVYREYRTCIIIIAIIIIIISVRRSTHATSPLPQIQFWRSEDPENVRTHDAILQNYDPCPVYHGADRMRRDVSQESTHVMNLWPFSRITAGVLVLNGGKKGELGETIEFTTPEGGEFYPQNFG